MKLTKETLKQLIKEELDAVMSESVFSKPSKQVQMMDFAVMIANEMFPKKHFIVLGDDFIFMKDERLNVRFTGNVEEGRKELQDLGYAEMDSEEIQNAYKEQRAKAAAK